MERKIGFTALKDVPRTNGEQRWRGRELAFEEKEVGELRK
jgi:hypothetical protein